jgi:hypothetical protein
MCITYSRKQSYFVIPYYTLLGGISCCSKSSYTNQIMWVIDTLPCSINVGMWLGVSLWIQPSKISKVKSSWDSKYKCCSWELGNSSFEFPWRNMHLYTLSQISFVMNTSFQVDRCTKSGYEYNQVYVFNFYLQTLIIYHEWISVRILVSYIAIVVFELACLEFGKFCESKKNKGNSSPLDH